MASVDCHLCLTKNSDFFHEDSYGKFYSCQRCKIVFKDPKELIPKSEELKQYELHNNDPNDQRYIDYLSKFTKPLMKYLESDQHGIDFGCGPGPAISIILEAQGLKVSNYDPFFNNNSELLDKKYDFLTSTEVVEHFYNANKSWALIKKLTKSNGIIAIQTNILYPEIDFKNWWYKKDITHVCFYRPESFQSIAEIFQLKIIDSFKNTIIFRN